MRLQRRGLETRLGIVSDESDQVAREEGVVADPDDTAAIETVGAAYEAWVSDIGYDPATTDMAGEELEEEE